MKCFIHTLALAALVSTSAAEGKWVSIFDGETLKGWTNSGGKTVTEGGWIAEKGVLYRKGKGGDLFTEKSYADFEFRWEWKISPKGNSGVKYRVTEYGKAKLGPEYQILDDAHPDGVKSIKRQAASLYDLFPANDKKKLNPVGDWNSSRVVVKGHHLQHYLNGKLVVDVTVGSDEWEKALKNSKFKDKENFATNLSGRIYLQDHGDKVWYRKLEVKSYSTTTRK
ncbi:MAG: hypothetical protein ACJAT6_001557 [Akkermansiaceae bacterium]|jgi:hypothetical protein|tara:strand:- start:63 stop:734 length:672 start_codon:yes stop_codon:yes gene_type:complete